jgi:hypothetical protein
MASAERACFVLGVSLHYADTFFSMRPDLSIWETSPFRGLVLGSVRPCNSPEEATRMRVIDDPRNPVFVSPAPIGRKILLYIGERKRGKTRIATPTTGEARILAHALMLFAEQKDEQYRQAGGLR